MNPTSDLFLAILAMDAYNRVGDDVTARSLVVPGNKVGDVTLSTAYGDNSIGFFAQSYVTESGQKIISYRGTDFFSTGESAWDIAFGWSLDAGLYWSSQAEAAAKVFQQVVAGRGCDPEPRGFD